MDKDKLERYNEIENARLINTLEATRGRIERGLSKLDSLALDALAAGLADQDVNVRLKAAEMYFSRVVPKVAVRSTEADAEVVESEAKKASRMEIEELLRKKKNEGGE